MKNKTETILLAFTAAHESLMSIPITEADEIELEVPEDIDNVPELPVSDVTLRGYELLEAIRNEEPYFQTIAEENRKANWADREADADRGLVTEINRSTSLVSVSDTVINCAEILVRHQFGYRNGSRNSKGEVLNKPYSSSEDKAAQMWAECIKRGSPAPVVAEDDGE